MFSSWWGHFGSVRNVCRSRVSNKLEGEINNVPNLTIQEGGE